VHGLVVEATTPQAEAGIGVKRAVAPVMIRIGQKLPSMSLRHLSLKERIYLDNDNKGNQFCNEPWCPT